MPRVATAGRESGKKYTPVDAKGGRPVNDRRFCQFTWYGEEKLSHKKDAEEAGQWRPYQGMMRVNPAQGAHEHETGYQQHDAGNEERRAKAEEEQLLAGEAQARESIARH